MLLAFLAGGSAITANLAIAGTQFYPNSVDLTQFGISGAWYNPSMSGQGLMISVIPNADAQGHAAYMGAWFTYADDYFDYWSGDRYQAPGTPMWLTLQGDTSNIHPDYGMHLTLYDNDGRNGNFAAPPVVPSSKLGNAYLSMPDCGHMHLHYTVQSGANWVDPEYRELDLPALDAERELCRRANPAAAVTADAVASFFATRG